MLGILLTEDTLVLAQVLFTDGVYIMAENLTKTSENTSVLLRDAAQILFAQIDA